MADPRARIEAALTEPLEEAQTAEEWFDMGERREGWQASARAVRFIPRLVAALHVAVDGQTGMVECLLCREWNREVMIRCPVCSGTREVPNPTLARIADALEGKP